ncbi:Uncharacterised protein [Vibrio cholerae]|nr:Uncharacterised protein [Vibrio cholerae]CSI50249.1 Uncharacterised protein [Vibrio cholerae]CSI54701.1 Uncharacterised protein [Vibrio cholerae]
MDHTGNSSWLTVRHWVPSDFDDCQAINLPDLFTLGFDDHLTVKNVV